MTTGSSSLDSVSDEESLRRHRHSIPGHLSSYLSFLTSLQQKAAAIVTPAVPVFSTAVISGSTSSPDLRDNFTGLSFSSKHYRERRTWIQRVDPTFTALLFRGITASMVWDSNLNLAVVHAKV
ncbi:inositol hexakisphosphate and diphosphoinositol-pentakisphosphate kinase-like [Penaeus monodon]|uniref:inositol hexakisphosphate and diphosphoinositol-pentakisphosphate kinase-like n=1 Tax=Penaeus monodon TaxID=6687 RepID=UPI0018A6F91C|nr:inositol hexakisphosphate and diphosphoinositol-pentakisphosphate kinase-like [Penaeus monodon]